MSLDFGSSVSINNLLALRAMYTFLFNYVQFEHPSFIDRLVIPHAKAWIERAAIRTMTELLGNQSAKKVSVSLNDVPGDMFSVLYIVQHPELVVEVSTGHELFQLLAQMALEFEKIRKPKSETGYNNESQQTKS